MSTHKKRMKAKAPKSIEKRMSTKSQKSIKDQTNTELLKIAEIPTEEDVMAPSIPQVETNEQRKDNRNHQWQRAMLSEEQVNSLNKQRDAWLAEEKNDNDNIIKDLIKSSKIYFSHSYVSQLHSRYKPIKSDGKFSDTRIGAFEITKWVTDPEEDSIDKLANFYQIFSKENCNIALIFHRKTDGCKVYMAVCDTAIDHQESTVTNVLVPRARDSLKGNFPGLLYKKESAADTVRLLLAPDKEQAVAVISNLAGEKSEKFRSQTIEKLLDGMVPKRCGSEYTIMMLAAPVSDFEEKVHTVSNTYTALSSHAVIQKSTNLSESASVSSAATKGLSVGGGISYGSGLKLGPIDGHIDIHAHVDGHWDSTMTEMKGVDQGKGETLTHTNYDVKYALDLLEKTMKRLEQCKATGMWNYATYVISQDEPMANNVAHMYASLIQGEESYMEESAVNVWCDSDRRKNDKEEVIEDPAQIILEALSKIQHPAFVLKNAGGESGNLPVGVDATNLFSTLELARAMNFPRKSVAGFPVTESAAFGRSISLLDSNENSAKVEIGKIWHMRQEDGGKVNLDADLLTSHVFITGSTGSGKSNTVYQLLDKLCAKDEGKHFLVVEPTKGEYKYVFGGRPDVTVYGTNYKRTKLLKINPFSFPEGVQLFAHLDRLIEIFNACWPMYAAMPAVLKDAMERAYVEAGWDLRTSENKEYGRLFPTFTDVLRQIDLVMNESDYSGDSKGDYKGALKTRLKSLTNGIYSDVFGCDEISEHELFDENVIVDLSEIGPETTSLIMGMLVLKLQEYRMTSKVMNAGLKHVTVLEEAHNLLKRTSTEQTSEGSNLVGKSVEMITNAIAEMRTYGECFMIVDQAPGALDPAAIRNTNTKIVLRLPDFSDRELVGKSIGLNDHQIIELSRLERGVAAVYQSGWIESVLCKFDRFEDEQALLYAPEEYKPDMSAGVLLNAVLYGSKVSEFASVIKQIKNSLIYKTALPVSLKRQIWKACASQEPIGQKELAGIAYELLNADALYIKKDSPTESEVAQQFRLTLQRYQISDLALKQNNLSVLIDLLNQEHRHRESNYVYSALMGGVR